MENGKRLLSDVVLCAACEAFMYLKGTFTPKKGELGTILEPVNLECHIICSVPVLSWNQFLIPILIILPFIQGGLSAI